MWKYVFGIVVEVFFETLCFFVGEIVIYVVSFGRLKTSLQKGNQTPRRQVITALIGLAVILGLGYLAVSRLGHAIHG